MPTATIYDVGQLTLRAYPWYSDSSHRLPYDGEIVRTNKGAGHNWQAHGANKGGLGQSQDAVEVTTAESGIIKEGDTLNFNNQDYKVTRTYQATGTVREGDGYADEDAPILAPNVTFYIIQAKSPETLQERMFIVAHDGTPIDGVIENIEFTSHPTEVPSISIANIDNDENQYFEGIDGIIEGTDDADTIDAGYTGDPEGDRVDNNDGGYGSTSNVDNNDVIYGYGGNDSIDAGDGNDRVHGGEGNDTIYGGEGNDTLQGWSGDDWLSGGAGNDYIYGGEGNDELYGNDGPDNLYGGEGNDTLDGGDDSDRLNGGEGNDLFLASKGYDDVYGGAGHDTYDSKNVTWRLDPPPEDGGDPTEPDVSKFISQVDVRVREEGDGYVNKYGHSRIDGSTEYLGYDGFSEIEHFVATADPGYSRVDTSNIRDSITFEKVFGYDERDQIQELDDNSAGTFTFDKLIRDGDGKVIGVDKNAGRVVRFGPTEEVKLSNILNEAEYWGGTIEITSGDQAGRVGNISFENFETINIRLFCFTPGTMIAVPGGEKDAADLKCGDMVDTMDFGPMPIRWIGRRKLSKADLDANPKFHPVQIAAGAMGRGLPRADLLVSPQHRMLVASQIVERAIDQDQCLIAATHLHGIKGIEQIEVEDVEYIHILLDSHQIIFANGVPTESMYLGPQVISGISQEDMEEITALFPDLQREEGTTSPRPARLFIKGKPARSIVQRHIKNKKPLLCLWPNVK